MKKLVKKVVSRILRIFGYHLTKYPEPYKQRKGFFTENDKRVNEKLVSDAKDIIGIGTQPRPNGKQQGQ